MTQQKRRSLASYFALGGSVRRPPIERRGAASHKGWEVRLSVRDREELADLRDALRQAGFIRLGHPFTKRGQLVQPLYGRSAVERFLALVGEVTA